jgi:hypothetical protein
MPAAPAKICGICKQDCSAKPRIKDPQGHYFCRDCVEKKQAASKAHGPGTKVATKPVVAPRLAAPEDQGVMARLIEDSIARSKETCPGCRKPMRPDAVVCVNCGYNRATSQVISTAVEKAPVPTPGKEGGLKKGVGVAAAAASAGLAPIFALVGAIIGGVAGAAAWVAIAIHMEIQINILAWGIGILCGVGAFVGARQHSSVLTGAMAAVIALGAMLGGRYFAVAEVVEDIKGEIARVIQVDDETAIAAIADRVAEARQRSGKTVEWPPDVTAQTAAAEEDYPPDIWAEAKKSWNKLSPDAKEAHRADVKVQLQYELEQMAEEVKGEGFRSTFAVDTSDSGYRGRRAARAFVWQFIFMGLGIMSAAAIGSGGNISFGGD